MSNRGGKRIGSGRPRGARSKDRPKIRDFVNTTEVEELVRVCKEEALKGRPELMKFLLEQIFGKAVQPIGNDEDKPFKVEGVKITFRE